MPEPGRKSIEDLPFVELLTADSELAAARREHARAGPEERQCAADWTYHAQVADNLWAAFQGAQDHDPFRASIMALAIDPAYAPAILTVGTLEYELGRPQQGWELLSQLPGLPAETPDLGLIIATATHYLVANEEVASATTLCQTAALALPRDPDIEAAVADLDRMTGGNRSEREPEPSTRPDRPRRAGQCQFCRKAFSKRGIGRHLKSCPERPRGRAKSLHLVVEDRDWHDFWLHIECPLSATLEDLDQILREVWLECCGHLSAFEIAGECFEAGPSSFDPWDGVRGRSMDVRIAKVLAPGDRFTYEYDFGSCTLLRGRLVGWEEAAAPLDEPRLMARNLLPEIGCSQCGAPADTLCTFCEVGPLCEPCATRHVEIDGEDPEALLPVVNSPRMGVCAYTG